MFGRRRLVFKPDDVLAHCRRADERRDVLRDPSFLKVVEKFGQRSPLDCILRIALRFAETPFHLIVERPHRELAEYLCSNALLYLAQRAAVHNQRRLRVGEHVDEARRDGHASGINNRRSGSPAQVANCGDAIGLDP